MRRILLRTSCGCERLILEDFGEDKPPPDIVVPCMQSRLEWSFNAPPKALMEAPIQVRNRRFKLTNQGWLGPGEDVYVYEEVL